MSEVIIYQNEQQQTQVSVRLDGDTVWLTQEQMSQLFGRERSVITKHIRNVFKEGELRETATCAKFAQVQTEGDRRVARDVDHYNLDVVISVGYRVKSIEGTRFRQWATEILRRHLVKGFTVNPTRLAERGLAEARDTLELLSRTLQNQALVDDTGRAVLDVILGYARTWRLLLEYDEDRLAVPAGAMPARGVLDYDTACVAIRDFKRELAARSEASALFGNERGESLQGILGAIEQNDVRRSIVPLARREGGSPVVLRDQGSPVLGRQQAHRFIPVHALPAARTDRAQPQSASPHGASLADRGELAG